MVQRISEFGPVVWEDHQRLNTGIPILLAGSVYQLGALEVAILLQPLRRFHNLERVGGGHQYLAQ